MRIETVLAALALCSCAAPQPSATAGEARELAGRTPGPAQRCVTIEPSASIRVSDSDSQVLLYGGGKTIWANDMRPGCRFGANDIIVTEPIGSFHCRGDIVHSIDRYTHIQGPSCVLGDFVPYSR